LDTLLSDIDIFSVSGKKKTWLDALLLATEIMEKKKIGWTPIGKRIKKNWLGALQSNTWDICYWDNGKIDWVHFHQILEISVIDIMEKKKKLVGWIIIRHLGNRH